MEFVEGKSWQSHECDDSTLQAKLVMEASFIGQTAMKGLDASRDELTKACADGSIVPQFAQTAAIGAGLAWMANSRLKLVGQGLTAVMGTQFVMDIAKSVGEVFGKSIDTWHNPENYQRNLKAASVSAGHFIYENALGALGVPTGAVLGHAASKIHFNGFGHGHLKPAHASASGFGAEKSFSVVYSVGHSGVTQSHGKTSKKSESAARDPLEFIEAELPALRELKTKDGEMLFSGNFFSLKEALETAVKENVSLKGVDLSCYDIRGADLRGANIEGAKFYFTDADGANFSGAKANGADFWCMNACNANFSGMEVGQANFTRMNASYANFSDMQADGANFHQMQADGANFSGAKANGADFREMKAEKANFSGMLAEGASFLLMNAKGADFSWMQAPKANFGNMQAERANFSGMQAGEADFGSMQAREADFTGLQAPKADFHFMDAEEANFTRANLEGAKFTGVIAEKANFTDANFDNAEVKDTWFKDANLSGVQVLGRIKGLDEAKIEWSQIDWDVNVPPVDWRPTETLPEDYYTL